MASDSVALSSTFGLWQEPYLWASAIALFVGLAVGQAARALFLERRRDERSARLKSRRIARAVAFLSLGILALAALLILADKGALVAGISRVGTSGMPGPLVFWAGIVACLGILAGIWPLAAGLPVLAVTLAGLVLVRLSLEGWRPLRPATAGGTAKIAELLPYEVAAASFRGHLELLERDSAPVTQELGLASNSVALSIENLKLTGPLAFLARLVLPPSMGNRDVSASRYYHLIGIAAAGGRNQAFAMPPHIRILNALLPLPTGGGQEPGSAAVSRGGILGMAIRLRQTSAATSLVALQPVSFSLSEEGILSVIQY